MGWQDRNWNQDDNDGFSRRIGGDWAGVRPTLDNPLTWSFPVGRLFGIDIRIHIVFVLFIIIKLLISLGSAAADDAAPLGFGMMAAILAALFFVVLLHEFGHCFACRATGGEADEILMWPLGGLAHCRPPDRWLANFITTAGGPAVNVAMCLLLIPAIGLLTGRWAGVALPNPFNPGGGLFSPEVAGSIWLTALYLLNYVSMVILLINLLPLYPFDGGRLMQSLLWSRRGYISATHLTVRIGYFVALAAGVASFPLHSITLFVIAVIGGVTCYFTYRQLKFTEEMMGPAADEYALTPSFTPAGSSGPAEEPRRQTRRELREQKRAERAAQQARKEETEVDRILKKIHDQGMDSLTSRERRLLNEVTERKKREG